MCADLAQREHAARGDDIHDLHGHVAHAGLLACAGTSGAPVAAIVVPEGAGRALLHRAPLSKTA